MYRGCSYCGLYFQEATYSLTLETLQEHKKTCTITTPYTDDPNGKEVIKKGMYFNSLSVEDVDVNLKQFGAKGDNVTDDTEKIQDAIDYCFNKNQRLKIPAGTYCFSQPIKIYGYLEEGFGTFILGDHRDLVKFKYIGDTNQQAAFDVVSSDPNYTGVLHNIFLRDFTIDGKNKVNNGIQFLQSNALSKYENIKVTGTIDNNIFVDADNFLNVFDTIRGHGGSNGINYNSGVVTSTTWKNCYMTGHSGTAYKIKGIYSHLDTPAADGCLGTVYDLNGFRGNVTSPGSESYEALYTFYGGEYTNATIINPYTWMNEDVNSVHLKIEGLGGKFTVIGGNMMYDRNELDTVSNGKLYDIGNSYTAIIELLGSVDIGRSQQAPNHQGEYQSIISNGRPHEFSSLSGKEYLDPTEGKPIWRNGSNWIDANGNIV